MEKSKRHIRVIGMWVQVWVVWFFYPRDTVKYICTCRPPDYDCKSDGQMLCYSSVHLSFSLGCSCWIACVWSSCILFVVEVWSLQVLYIAAKIILWWSGWRGGSVGRAADSRSKDLRLEPRLRQEHNTQFVRVFPSQNVLSWLAVSVPQNRVYTHA